jgi:type IV fimbrial biogenesis protein FimT
MNIFFHLFLKKNLPLRCEADKWARHQCPWVIAPYQAAKVVRTNWGFTLIELVVTVCVLAILLVIALPSYQTMILNNRLTASTDSLIGDLNYARSVALNDNTNINICPFSAANSTTCGADWTVGWIVVNQPAVGTATLLKSQQNDDKAPTVTSTLNLITFDARGLASGQAHFSLCDSRGGSFARSVEVMTTGFIQSGDTPGKAAWNNKSITCP